VEGILNMRLNPKPKIEEYWPWVLVKECSFSAMFFKKQIYAYLLGAAYKSTSISKWTRRWHT
jgi:hypothetical protein